MNKPLPPLPPKPEPFKNFKNNSAAPDASALPKDKKKEFGLPERPGKPLNEPTFTPQVFNTPKITEPEAKIISTSGDIKTPEGKGNKFPTKITVIIAASVLALGAVSFGATQFVNSLVTEPVVVASEETATPSEDPYSSMTEEEVDETLENMESIDEDMDTLEGLLAPRTQQPFPTSTYRSVPLDPNDEHDATFKRVLDSVGTPSVYSLEQLKAAVLDACVIIADGATKEQYYDWVYSLEDPVEFMEASGLGYRHYCPASNEIFEAWLVS